MTRLTSNGPEAQRSGAGWLEVCSSPTLTVLPDLIAFAAQSVAREVPHVYDTVLGVVLYTCVVQQKCLLGCKFRVVANLPLKIVLPSINSV